mmetsp:Transcript_37459/g.107268  ORF Transcript_37459/g.107268 Transcript_37459/m.107268 type:complete len:205 (+) Transcript_37459:1117-1731(+)
MSWLFLATSPAALAPCGRSSVCFSWSSRRAAATAPCASTSAAIARSSVSGIVSASASLMAATASFTFAIASSASPIRCLMTETTLARFRFPVSLWKACTRSTAVSICSLNFSSSLRASAAAFSERRPTSTILSAMYLCASASAACARAAALSIFESASADSSGGIVSKPIRKGASVSRILLNICSMAASRSAACLRMGCDAARD